MRGLHFIFFNICSHCAFFPYPLVTNWNLWSKSDLKAKFVGFQNRSAITKFYAISDLGIVISDYDPSPKAMNEIMNFGMPIVVTNVVGTANDLVKENQNGFIINVGDVNALSKKIDYLNNNRDIAKIMGEKSLEIVNNWNYDKDVQGIENAIEYVKKIKYK